MTTSNRARRRVTVVVSHLVPTLGMESAALRVLEGLKKDYDLRVVSLAGGAEDRSVWPEVIIGAQRQLRGWKRAATLLRARRLLTGDASDVRLMVGAPAAAAVLLTGRVRGASDVVWEHSLSRARLERSFALRCLWALLRRRYARARAVVAVSPPVADLMRDGGAATTFIPNVLVRQVPVAGARQEKGSDEPFALLCVGTLSSLKNQRVAIDALAQLPAGSTLTILGDGPLRKKLEDHARALGVADRVTFAGHVSRDDVSQAMRTADILVHPATSETFGLVFVEAADHHLPVVSADHPAARWLVPAFVPGVVVPGGDGPGSAADLARAIAGVLASPPDAAQWAHADEARSREFDAAATAQRWADLIEETVTCHDESER